MPDDVRWDCCELVMPRIMELPRKEGDGAPAGVKECEAEGGGAAGVVVGSVPKANLPAREGLSGVETSLGSLKLENGFDMVV